MRRFPSLCRRRRSRFPPDGRRRYADNALERAAERRLRHRAYISCLFCDLRGFTAFSETAAPEELLDVLREYHGSLGELIPIYEGTFEHFAGDGLMVFFNDPLPLERHELRAVGSRSPRRSGSRS